LREDPLKHGLRLINITIDTGTVERSSLWSPHYKNNQTSTNIRYRTF